MSEPTPDDHTAPPEGDRAGVRRKDVFSLLVVLTVTVLAYAPLVQGIVRMSVRTTQAVNAFLLLGFAFADALLTVTKSHRFCPYINIHGLTLFSLSFLALALASFASLWPLAILGLCLNLAALISFSFGRSGVGPFYPALAGLGTAVVMLVFVPPLDGLLRTLAAHLSSGLLAVLDIQTDVVVRQDPFRIVLVAERGAGVFDVATECNGFGIILSSVTLSVILVLRRRFRWYAVAGLPVLALAMGEAFNTVRIVAIVVAALQTNVEYGFIHEGLGTAVYLVALIAVCAVIRWVPARWRRPAGLT